MEYNPNAREVGPLVNWMINYESEKWPMVNFGTSSDRIGTPIGPRAYYVTFAKTITSLNIVPYASINYSEFDAGFNFPFGANVFLDKHWVLLPMFDGRKTHLLLTYRGDSFSVSLIWVWLKHPGIGMSWGF